MEVGRDVTVPSSEFDGKVVYGEKRKGTGTVQPQHALYVLREAEYVVLEYCKFASCHCGNPEAFVFISCYNVRQVNGRKHCDVLHSFMLCYFACVSDPILLVDCIRNYRVCSDLVIELLAVQGQGSWLKASQSIRTNCCSLSVVH